ncbi:T9SS type A sorting domain-containing protein [bacterium]|nr:T9SS type A sorting domain-containing protein [bacterium]
MRKITVGIIILVFSLYKVNAYNFRANKIAYPYRIWTVLQYDKFETRIDVQGLFYQTTTHMKLKLGKNRQWDSYRNRYQCTAPPSGDYTWTWIFELPDETYITDMEIWDVQTQQFVRADMLNLSKAETLMDNQTGPRALLREYRSREYNANWSHFYRLEISPVNRDESVELIMRTLSPCQMYWDVRRFYILSRQFYNPYELECNSQASAVFYVLDHDHPEEAPRVISDMPSIWERSGDYWTAETGPDNINFYDNSILRVPQEVQSGSFIQVSEAGDNKFYQMACSPQIGFDRWPSRHIVIGIDLMESSYFGRQKIFEKLYYPLTESTSSKDSVIFLISDFNPTWLSYDFQQASASLIDASLNQAENYVPKLTTMPFMLREAVELLNKKGLSGEIWLISNDTDHGYPAGTVMEILQQTYFNAENPLVFRIIDASSYGSAYSINNKYYQGNQYLYENLFRLSRGSFICLRDYHEYDWTDAGIDCFAPTVTSVEVDLIPQGGLTYSAVNLNRGRQHFHNMSRYFQIGLFNASQPYLFSLGFFGNYQDTLYQAVFDFHENNHDVPEDIQKWVIQYWYGHYIRNELLLQPQSYETIDYIEQLAIEQNVLTPYSGLVIPGPEGSIGFQKLTASDSVFTETSTTSVASGFKLPESFRITVYPNPFNPKTRIIMSWLPDIITEPIQMTITNVMGQVVFIKSLDACSQCGKIEFQWDGRTQESAILESGVYFLHVQSGEINRTLKMMIVR